MTVKAMMMLAAVAAATSAANAADLNKPAKPAVDYVKVCDAYGAGFFYIPGSDTCLKITGYLYTGTDTGASNTLVGAGARYATNNGTTVASTVYGGPLVTGQRGANLTDSYIRADEQIDARTNTDYGLLRSWINFHEDLNTSAGNSAVTSVRLDRGIVQFGGLTAGRTASFYTYEAPVVIYNNFGNVTTTGALINLLAYTFSFGNGVTATLSIEDPTTGGTMTTAAAPPSGQYGSRRNGSSFTYGALQAPDVVGNVNITQAWGSAQISGGLHQDYGSTAAMGTKWGFGVQGGVKFFTPQVGVGDWIKFQGTYSVGAIEYTMWPEAFSLYEKSSAAGASNAYTDLGADAVWSSSTGIKQTTAYSIYGEYAHNITPQLEFDVGGGFAHFANTNVYYGNNGNTYGQLEGEVQFQWKPAKNLFIMPYVEYRDLSFNSNTVADYGLAHSNVQAIDFGLRFQRNF